MDKALIEKAFEKWWWLRKDIVLSNQKCGLVSEVARNAWNACAKLMSNRVKELEAEYKKEYDLQEKTYNRLMDTLNKISELQAESVKWTHTAQYRLSQHLQTKLDEAVEIIKTISKNANHYDKIDLENKAEQFLSSLDKPIKEEL